MSKNEDSAYYKWIEKKYNELHKVEIKALTDEFLTSDDDDRVDGNDTLGYEIEKICPVRKPWVHKMKNNGSNDGMNRLVDLVVPIRYSKDENDSLHIRLMGKAYKAFDKSAYLKNIMICMEHKNSVISILDWFSKYHDITDSENIAYLTSILLILMKNNREEYEEKAHDPDPFEEPQETTSEDIRVFRSMVVIDMEEIFALKQGE